jgi:hypothetical protein
MCSRDSSRQYRHSQPRARRGGTYRHRGCPTHWRAEGDGPRVDVWACTSAKSVALPWRLREVRGSSRLRRSSLCVRSAPWVVPRGRLSVGAPAGRLQAPYLLGRSLPRDNQRVPGRHESGDAAQPRQPRPLWHLVRGLLVLKGLAVPLSPARSREEARAANRPPAVAVAAGLGAPRPPAARPAALRRMPLSEHRARRVVPSAVCLLERLTRHPGHLLRGVCAPGPSLDGVRGQDDLRLS